MQINKNGIPISFRKASKQMKQQKQQKRNQELHEKLDFREFAEFRGMEQGCEITIAVPAFEPLVQAIQKDGWIYVKTSKGEIA